MSQPSAEAMRPLHVGRVNQPTTYGSCKRGVGFRRRTREERAIEKLFWWYLWFLVLEGAVRKWILPELSGPLLLVRDPLAIAVWVYAIRGRLISKRMLEAVVAAAVCLVFLVAAQLATGVGSALVAVFGLRSYLLHLPLIVVFARVLNDMAVHRLGKLLAYIAIPMVVLMGAQYQAGPESILNAASAEGMTQLGSVEGKVRSSGTFSFTNGAQMFFTLVAAFVIDAWVSGSKFGRVLLMLATLATVVVIPVSGSRTLFFSVLLLAMAISFTDFERVWVRGRLMVLMLALAVALGIASQTDIFGDALSSFLERYDNASSAEGGTAGTVETRVLGGFIEAFDVAKTTGWLGEGVGMGSNVAAYLQTGAGSFLLAEGEWPRLVLEMGPVAGLTFMFSRLAIAALMMAGAFRMKGPNRRLAVLLAAMVCPIIVTSNMTQPTALGFMTVGGAVCVALIWDSKRTYIGLPRM